MFVILMGSQLCRKINNPVIFYFAIYISNYAIFAKFLNLCKHVATYLVIVYAKINSNFI